MATLDTGWDEDSLDCPCVGASFPSPPLDAAIASGLVSAIKMPTGDRQDRSTAKPSSMPITSANMAHDQQAWRRSRPRARQSRPVRAAPSSRCPLPGPAPSAVPSSMAIAVIRIGRDLGLRSGSSDLAPARQWSSMKAQRARSSDAHNCAHRFDIQCCPCHHQNDQTTARADRDQAQSERLEEAGLTRQGSPRPTALPTVSDSNICVATWPRT